MEQMMMLKRYEELVPQLRRRVYPIVRNADIDMTVHNIIARADILMIMGHGRISGVNAAKNNRAILVGCALDGVLIVG